MKAAPTATRGSAPRWIRAATLAACAAVQLSSAGCGGRGDPTWACDYGSLCVSISGPQVALDTITSPCASPVSSCTAAGRIARCVLEQQGVEGTLVLTYSYYPPHTLAQAEQSCTQAGGRSFQPG